MIVFWSTPRNVRIAKITAILLTISFLIVPMFDWSYTWTSYSNSQWEITLSIGLLLGVLFEVFLIAIVIFECKCLIFIAVVVLAINIVIFTISANCLLIAFATSLMTTLKDPLHINNEKDAFWNCILMQLFLIVIWILLFVRYYAVLTVYRWTKLPRISVTSGGPRITVQNI